MQNGAFLKSLSIVQFFIITLAIWERNEYTADDLAKSFAVNSFFHKLQGIKINLETCL